MMLEKFTGPECGVEGAIAYARKFDNMYLQSIVVALELGLKKRNIEPILVTKEEITEPTSAENSSEANKDGKIFLIGVTKSICWEDT